MGFDQVFEETGLTCFVVCFAIQVSTRRSLWRCRWSRATRCASSRRRCRSKCSWPPTPTPSNSPKSSSTSTTSASTSTPKWPTSYRSAPSLPSHSIHPSIHSSVYPSIHPSIHPSIYLSIQSVTQSASHSFNQRNVAAIFGRYYLVFWETCRRRANPPARCQLAHESADQRCRFFIPPHLKWLNQRKMRRKLTKTKTETKK